MLRLSIIDWPPVAAPLINQGFFYVRNIVTVGYAGVIEDRAAGLIAQLLRLRPITRIHSQRVYRNPAARLPR